LLIFLIVILFICWLLADFLREFTAPCFQV